MVPVCRRGTVMEVLREEMKLRGCSAKHSRAGVFKGNDKEENQHAHAASFIRYTSARSRRRHSEYSSAFRT
jgi:hypothetical protein